MKIKISIIFLMFFILLITLPTKCVNATNPSEIFRAADENFLGSGSIVGTINEEPLESTSNFLFKVLLIIGIVVMVMVGTIIGIKFMIASVEDKAKVKEALVPYIIGCAVILGAFTIWSIAVDIGQSIFPTKNAHTSSSADYEEAQKEKFNN